MAEAGRVLRELPSPHLTRATKSRRRKSRNWKAQRTICGFIAIPEPRAAQLSAGRLRLDPDLDFVIHEEGAIELTEAGFRRMLQAHSAGFNAVIGIGSREVLRLPAPKLGHAPSADGSGKQSTRDVPSLSRLTFD